MFSFERDQGPPSSTPPSPHDAGPPGSDAGAGAGPSTSSADASSADRRTSGTGSTSVRIGPYVWLSPAGATAGPATAAGPAAGAASAAGVAGRRVSGFANVLPAQLEAGEDMREGSHGAEEPLREGPAPGGVGSEPPAVAAAATGADVFPKGGSITAMKAALLAAAGEAEAASRSAASSPNQYSSRIQNPPPLPPIFEVQVHTLDIYRRFPCKNFILCFFQLFVNHAHCFVTVARAR